MAKWDASAGDWRAAGLLPSTPDDPVRSLPDHIMERFYQRKCWAGVDLSMTTDLSAVALVFPASGGSYEVLPFF
jgi:phage terminase large subunit-like protein